jgi:hypothetical protein
MLAVAKPTPLELDPSIAPGWWAIRVPVIVAIVITLLNAVKPLCIDDTAYYYYADQVSRAPLSPYGFEVFWGSTPVPAMDVLAPPVIPYWWGLGIALFGQNPIAWKLWLFPVCLVLTTSLWAIFRRFARGLETPLVWMTALSPAILPGLNLMLDVPAIALSLASLALFFRAVDRRSMASAALAGLVAGLAAQTKYTGLTATGVMMLYALWSRQIGLGLVGSTVAAGVFMGMEGLIALAHGKSHLLNNLGRQTEGSKSKWELVSSLPMLLGAVAPAVTMLGLAALRLPRRWILLVGASVLAFLCVTGLVPRMNRAYSPQVLFWKGQGFLALFVAALVAWRLMRRPDGEAEPDGQRPSPPLKVFLGSWLVLEIVAYFALSTFPATRRIPGIIVAMTALNGALASRACVGPARAAVLPWLLASAVGLGGLFYAIDLAEAVTEVQAVERAEARLGDRQGRAPTWFIGHWGIQFYGERAGMKPIIAGRSHVAKGDWLVVPDDAIDRQSVSFEPDQLELVETIDLGRRFPLRTVGGYFSDRALWGSPKTWVTVTVYRAARDFVPAAPAPQPKPGATSTQNGTMNSPGQR